jgi:membrane-bound lytic murein transglycosylase D
MRSFRLTLATTACLLASCARAQVQTTPNTESIVTDQQVLDSPILTAKAAASIPRITADSAADEAALQSLQTITPDATIPELSIEPGPSWDLRVQEYADHPRVQYYLDFFGGRGKERFQVWLDRMPRFETFARSSLAERKLPGDLVYLALIESGFSMVATSRSKAVGMWQFMAPTGKSYGLRIDSWLDERRDPIKATTAATEYLRDLTDRFGSHYLAAAAYNGGPGRVGRGLARIPALMGEGDEAIDPQSDEAFFELAGTALIHQETKDYVPKLIAAALIAKDPESYGFRSPEESPAFPLDSVIVEGGTGLDLIAKLADVPTEAIRELNPHILRMVTPPGQRYAVRLPTGMAALVSEKYAAVPASERMTMATHIVKRGETLGGIAARYGIDVALLTSANRSARARSLQVGSTLFVPVAGSTIPADAMREPEPAVSRSRTHIVRRGETLGGIAQRYGVTSAAVRSANGMSARSNLIRAGQKLTVPGGGNVPAARASRRVYTVQRGDTVGSIAERHGVGASTIIAANKLGKAARIRVGQRLVIGG